jgi:quinol monooxygenase YgiN
LKDRQGAKDMIVVTIRMMIPAQKHDEALKMLKSVAKQCKVYPGCLGCHILRDVLEGKDLVYEELWRSQEELERRLRSDEYRSLLIVMEMALKHPEVKFNTVSNSMGIEMIEKTRSPELHQGDIK